MAPLLGQRPILRRRFDGAGTTTDGEWSPPPYEESIIYATVQPLTGDEMQALESGKRSRQPRKLYTYADLRVVDQERGLTTTGTVSDQVIIDDFVYEIVKVERQPAVKPHYKATALRLQEGT